MHVTVRKFYLNKNSAGGYRRERSRFEPHSATCSRWPWASYLTSQSPSLSGLLWNFNIEYKYSVSVCSRPRWSLWACVCTVYSSISLFIIVFYHHHHLYLNCSRESLLLELTHSIIWFDSCILVMIKMETRGGEGLTKLAGLGHVGPFEGTASPGTVM